MIADSERHVRAFSDALAPGQEGDGPIDVPVAHVWTVAAGRLARLRFFTDTALLASALAAGRR